MKETRTERDSMGEMEVSAEVLYGASTARAVENFPISGVPLPPKFIHAYGLIKGAAAATNAGLGLLEAAAAEAIAAAAEEIAGGLHDRHFPVDIYQTGSGTSTNMNLNEVIAHLCEKRGVTVHANDHVNLGQSSNDTFPTAIHLSAALALKENLMPVLEALAAALEAKAEEFHGVLKIGRTHLMDATPVRLGQEFRGWARQATLASVRASKALAALAELPLGGTAVGTGLNAHPEFAARTIRKIAERTGLELREAEDHFEAQSAKDACVEAHGQLATIAVSLHKIACDLRLLGSGPRCGIGEIKLPATQPGSSIMPGKVNPVIAEAVTMVAARVAGNQTTLSWCGAGGYLELNVSMPLIAACLLESIGLLANAAEALRTKCVEGIEANDERCRELIEYSLSMVTSLVPAIGYDKAAAIAKESVATGRTVRELCGERLGELGISAGELEEALDPGRMAGA
ncbi:class II fumarate hydratase [Luteolibacter sp. Populi]|uniref:class II fumarate hydratase n=1 Tax=Luteolibacter sp. Populi TaxID=3230487 RepID=UPI003465A35A